MSVVYLDTSALVKLYVAETGSTWMASLLGHVETGAALSSQLAIVEATCAFARRRREGALRTDQYERLLEALRYDAENRFALLDVVPATIEAACALAGRHPLRAYDALHLATAWLANETLVGADRPSLVFVAADESLLGAARSEGLAVENPNEHM